ncbi:SRPBCC family protein [Pseudonocardia sichuanensis]|uniref:Polyketide cyclase/dehydrase/lipid transport protein n=1 Tax=Pseudonocardia kunmingensis TaxID=630975 RepID=A0A543E225_9PSEU|nr:SRPBCC family protein [Pseudonocardia kunmingensis]TQM15647.1 polyketide cyclase/dehydrase/lipid transport protein [Pseudonocardia kunmingensis]
MELFVERDVRASAERVWAVLADPESWPRWTESMREVRLLDGDLGLGSRVRIVQPKLLPMEWTVTEVVPGAVLTWIAAGPGLRTTGTHSVRSRPDGTARLRLGLTHRGLLAPVVAGLYGRRSRRYVELEADGLRAAAEAA